MRFGRVSEIQPSNIDSWQDSIFLTIDIDWSHDKILADTIDLVEQAGVATTWFITHKTPLLEGLRESSLFELGIHPNFNFLLQGNAHVGKTAQDVIDRLLNVIPEATSVRSHSMTQSSRLLDLFDQRALTHDCNHFIPEQSGIELKPYLHWNGLIKVPYFWEDDVSCLYSHCFDLERLLSSNGLKVFDFHPIHIFLNTESLERYEQTRHLHNKPNELIKYRYGGEGTRTWLLQLLKLAKRNHA